MNVWEFSVDAYNKNDAVKNGNRFLIGNGYLGVRGTAGEFGKEELAAVNLAGVYDRFQDKWREPVNAPNALYFKASVGGKALSLLENEALTYRQSLDIKYGLHKINTVFEQGKLCSERFASMDNCHLICAEFVIEPSCDAEITVTSGIDGDVWDINGPHLFGCRDKSAMPKSCGFPSRDKTGEMLESFSVTGELKTEIAVAEILLAGFSYKEEFSEKDNSVFRIISFQAEKGKSYTFKKYSAVVTSLDCAAPEKEVQRIVREAAARGYGELKEEHCRAWEKIWGGSAVSCDNEEVQQAINYSLYHLHSIAPRHSGSMSIPARGLSGQTYKGAIFWDTEIFMLPFFVHTEPKAARALLSYRIETLSGALKKAREYGYRGAFYAWESQEGGAEGCTDFNVTDVFTGRPVRTYFRDKQIHISGDIAYAIVYYYDMTADDSILLNGGAEVIFECARFYLSRAYQNVDTKAIEFLDVVGPDEYHERVNNNAFTNRLAKLCFDKAIEYSEYLAEKYPAEYGVLCEKIQIKEDLKTIESIKDSIYKPKIQGGIIEQFDGYFGLEDCSIETVRSRLKDPREYWGSSNGVAAHTKVIKQADVITMLHLFADDYETAEVAENWNYYEPRTEHGSSLSACMYALTACRIGMADLAYDFFMKSATVDLIGEGKQWAGEIYIGGTHPAANGGAWLIAALGFAGLKVRKGSVTLNPCLPGKIKFLRFPITVEGKRYMINVEKDKYDISEF